MNLSRRLLVLAVGLPLAFLLVWMVATWSPGGPPKPPPAPAPAPAGPAPWRVLGPDEAPRAGVPIELFAVAPWRLEPVSLGRTVTGADGGVRGLGPVPAGESPVLVVLDASLPPAVFRPDPGETDLPVTEGRRVGGAVLDLDGNPIAGARILHPKEPPFLIETRSGEDGRFDLGRLPSAETLRVEAEGRAPLDLEIALFLPGADTMAVTLPPAHRVAGRVVDTHGDPVAGAVVELEQESVTRVATGPDGEFLFAGVLPDWEVLLTPFAEGRVGETDVAWCDQADVTLVLYRPAAIRGTVVAGRSGFPVPGFEIRRHAFTREPDGGFVIPGLPPGPVRVAAHAGSRTGEITVELAEGEVREGVRVALYPPRWGGGAHSRAAWPVTVRAVDAKSGAPLVGLRIADPDAGESARTDADGRLVIHLPAGRRRLVAGGPLETHAEAEVEFELPREEEVEVRLAPNASVSVVATGRGAGGRGQLWVAVADGSEVGRYPVEDGRGAFPAVPGDRLALRMEVDGCLPGHLLGVVVPEGRVLEIPLERGAFVTGRAVEPSGRSLARVGVEIEALPPEARFETAGDGRIRVGPVRPGRHRILVNARNVRTRRFAVDVPPEGLDLGDVVMAGPCRLDVRVLTSAGAPIPGALVSTTFRVAAKGLTDGDGRIALPGTELEEAVRAEAEGYLDGWQQVRIPDGTSQMDVTFRLFRPARLTVRTTDAAGFPVDVLDPGRADLDAALVGRGELLLTNLAPGELVLDLECEDGRRGTLRHIVTEGEGGLVSVTLE